MPLGVVTRGLFLWISVAVEQTTTEPKNKIMVYIWFTLFRFFDIKYFIINYLIKIMVYIKTSCICKIIL